MRFSKKIIVLMFASMFVFTIAMSVIYWCRGGVPDTLVDRFFGFFGIEGGALGVIKIAETLSEKFGVENTTVKKQKKKK